MKFSEYFDLNRAQPYLDFVDIQLDSEVRHESIFNRKEGW
jgi:hypothetical protein